MKNILKVLVALFLCTPTLGEHLNEPIFDTLNATGDIVHYYGEDSDFDLYSPLGVLTFNNPEINSDLNDGFTIAVSCAGWLNEKKILSNDIHFEFFNLTDPNTYRSMGRIVSIRFDQRSPFRYTLNNYREGREGFIITDWWRDSLNYENYIYDEKIVEYFLYDLLTIGSVQIDVRDGNRSLQAHFVARPYPHVTKDIFNAAAECYYGKIHPEAPENHPFQAASSKKLSKTGSVENFYKIYEQVTLQNRSVRRFNSN